MAGIKIVDLPPLGRDLASTDLLELSLAGGTGSRKITGQEIMNASKLSINNTPIINGTVGRVLFQGTGDVLQQSSSLFWDNTNGFLGIGTSSPTAPFTIKFTGQTGQDFYISGSGSNTHNIGGGNTLNIVHPNITAGASFGTAYGSVNRYFSIGSSFNLNARLAVLGGGTTSATSSFLVLNNSSTELFRIRDNGNVGINTTTDAGFRLDVNGTGRFSGNLTVATGFEFWFNNGNVGLYRSANTLRLGGFGGIEFLASATTITSQTIRMKVFDTGNVGINTTTDAGFRLDVNGTARVQGPTGYSMVYDSSGVLNSYGTYNALKMYNSATLLCVNLGSEGSNGRLELGQNGSSYIRLNGGSSANDNYINGATLIGANYSSANSSSVLECRSTTKGFLPPRMTTTQKNAIATPAAGLVVYDTTLNKLCVYTTAWETVTSL